MFNSPRTIRDKPTARGKKRSPRSINQLLQRTLSCEIEETTLLSWKDTVKSAMRAGRTTAIVAYLEADIHYKWIVEATEKNDSHEIVAWKFKKTMTNALVWTTAEGLSSTLIFDRKNGLDCLPQYGCLTLQWFPSRAIEFSKDSLMGFWRVKMAPVITNIKESTDKWRRMLRKGLVDAGQTCVTLMLLELNCHFYIKAMEIVKKGASKLCCKGKCRDYLTKEILPQDLIRGRIFYLDQSLEGMIDYVTKKEGLDWFLGFDLTYKQVYVPGETSISKTIESFRNNANGHTNKTITLEDLEKFEVIQKGKSEEEKTIVRNLSPWAYFMVTKRGW